MKEYSNFLMQSARIHPKSSEGAEARFRKAISSKFAGKTRKQTILILELIREMIHSKTALRNISSQQFPEGGKQNNAFRVLVSTVLSARTKDPVTEAAAARLFARFPDPRMLSRAKVAEVSELIKPVLYYNVKAKRIIEISKILTEKYHGTVPSDFEALLDLPGVGRKTANCVLVYAFNTPAIPVDVHVHRISNRIGLVRTKTPEETEAELSKLYEKKYWLDVNELFVAFGQTVCLPRIPHCEVCSVRPSCDYYQNYVKREKAPSSV